MTTYATLKADINEDLARDFSDTKLARFVRQAEAHIGRVLRVQQMITRETWTLAAVADSAAGSYTLPTNWLEFRTVSVPNVLGPDLDYRTPKTFFTEQAYFQGSAPPLLYTTEGGTFYATPGGVVDVSVAYYARFAALSGAGDTNWLLTNHYDVFLFASLAAAAEHEQDFEHADRLRNLAERQMRELNTNDRRSRISGDAPAMHSTVGP